MVDSEFFRIMSGVTFLGVTAFIAVFATEPWHRSHFGRSLMAMAVAVWLFSLTSALRHWLGPDYWGRTEVRTVAQCLIAYATWSRLVVLVKVKYGERIERRRELRRQKNGT